MNSTDRMVIELLCQYKSHLHKDFDLTNTEVSSAKKFAKEFLSKEKDYKFYNSNFEIFINKQIFQKNTNQSYDNIARNLYETFYEVNQIANIDSWRYNIYYNNAFNDYILIGIEDEYGLCSESILKYDMLKNKLIPQKTKIKDDYSLLGIINNFSFDYKKDSIQI